MKRISNFVGLKVYFIGIGGISMSGLAKIMLSQGAIVSGSDISTNQLEVHKLRALGVKINDAHLPENITTDIDLVVYNSAIKEDNLELKRAKVLNIKTIERAELLGLIADNCNYVISISGTHGKTTTTALISEIFVFAGLNPTVHIGGESVNLGSNTVIGGNKYFIVEACEYCNSFRYLHSDCGLILNVEADHLDYYKDLEDIYTAFVGFAHNSNCVIVDKSVNLSHKNKTIIGIEWVAKNIKFSSSGYDYDVYHKGTFWASIRLNVLGKHNITNSLFAIVVADKYGIDKAKIVEAVARFKGVARRCEKIGEEGKIPVIIDYAHHPTEIGASIRGIREEYLSPLIIFQPHTYTRTLALFNEFKSVFGKEKDLILYPTYPAREVEILGGRAIDLVINLPNSIYARDFNELLMIIKDKLNLQHFDAVLILGAGDLAEKMREYYLQISAKNLK